MTGGARRRSPLTGSAGVSFHRTSVRPVERVVDLSVPIYEGMPVDDLGPKFWVRLSHAASRPLYQYTQSREGRVFLARRSIEPGAGLWTYPGGFLEIGESAQEGARRETKEETQLRVEVGRLIGAYSRPHVSVVTLIYEATVVGGEALPGVETIEVRDFGPDEIPWEELAFTTGESALRDWVASLPGRGPRFEPELYVMGDPDAGRDG